MFLFKDEGRSGNVYLSAGTARSCSKELTVFTHCTIAS